MHLMELINMYPFKKTGGVIDIWNVKSDQFDPPASNRFLFEKNVTSDPIGSDLIFASPLKRANVRFTTTKRLTPPYLGVNRHLVNRINR